MATNDFLPFATDGGANVLSQAAYELLTTLIGDGFQTGIAISEQLNKVWRQGTVMAAAVGQLAADTTGLDILDDGDLTTLQARIALAIQLLGSAPPTRIVTASTNFTLDANDGVVGLNRTAGLSALTITVPTPLFVGKSYTIEDLAGNFFSYNVTLQLPVGMTVRGANTFVLNQNFQSATLRYYGSDLWSIKN